MDADFWLARWEEGATHFHQQRVTPLLQKYWPALALPAGSKVLVPLCGKSLDMIWLAKQGHQVLGVELAEVAVQQFFSENALDPVMTQSERGRHYRAGNIEIICGDIFALDEAVLGECLAAYDRAALVALPEAMRARYAAHVYGKLSRDYRGLLLTLDYPQAQMPGPPFSVGDDEVQRLFVGHSTATLLSRRDILDKEPKFAERGLKQLDTLVYKLAAGI